MVKLNCDSANKIIKQLQADRDALLEQERVSQRFSYIAGEEPDRPKYDFAGVQRQLDSYAKKILKLKHAVNVFNVSTTLPEVGMTIDVALVEMTMLSDAKRKFNTMRNAQPRTRATMLRGVSEYTELNYDVGEAQAQYKAVCDRLMAIQQALNIANLTQTFEVDIEL